MGNLNIGYLTCGTDEGSDECLTPRYAVLPLVKHLKDRGYQTIWCPFDLPTSFYVRVLEENGFTVVSSHLSEGKDFFLMDTPKVDCIVSNPPFSCKDKVLRRLYEIGLPFAMLLPQNSLQSTKRVPLFLEHGLEYLGFDRRVCFYTNGNLDAWKSGNHFASGYFCKDVMPAPLQFEKLTPIQESYL